MLISNNLVSQITESYVENLLTVTQEKKGPEGCGRCQTVLSEIGIEEGMAVADVGAGCGYFTFRISCFVGERGRVYASDIDNNGLDFIRSKLKNWNIGNIFPVHGEVDNPKKPVSDCDLILIVNTMKCIDDFAGFMQNLKKSVTKDGKVVLVQWDADRMFQEDMIYYKARYSKQASLARIEDAGLKNDEKLTFLPMQNIFVCSMNYLEF